MLSKRRSGEEKPDIVTGRTKSPRKRAFLVIHDFRAAWVAFQLRESIARQTITLPKNVNHEKGSPEIAAQPDSYRMMN